METIPQCWVDVSDALASGIDRLILFGAPGTGKTYAGLSIGVPIGEDSHRVICNEDMTASDVTGSLIPTESGTWKWNDGALLKAWKGNGERGGRAVLDEIDRASGDVLSLMLAMTDSPESASWTNPITGKVFRPLDGFSVVMTTNLEEMNDLPTALRDRFPVAIRIDRPHPRALERLSEDLRSFASASVDAQGDRRFSLRAFYAFDKLRSSIGEEKASRMIFGKQAQSVLDAIRIESLS